MGTAGYMAPEQAAGQPVDFRADQFALGVVLYELLSGKRAFRRASAAESLAALLREEPEPLPPFPLPLDAPLRWVLARCLAKEPDGRYGSTRDLARDLAELAALAAGRASAAPRREAPRRGRLVFTLLLVAVVAGAAAALLHPSASRGRARSLPTFQQLTFRRGALYAARFTPGGEAVVYGAAWDGTRARPYSVRVEGGASVPVGERERAGVRRERDARRRGWELGVGVGARRRAQSTPARSGSGTGPRSRRSSHAASRASRAASVTSTG